MNKPVSVCLMWHKSDTISVAVLADAKLLKLNCLFIVDREYELLKWKEKMLLMFLSTKRFTLCVYLNYNEGYLPIYNEIGCTSCNLKLTN